MSVLVCSKGFSKNITVFVLLPTWQRQPQGLIGGQCGRASLTVRITASYEIEKD